MLISEYIENSSGTIIGFKVFNGVIIGSRVVEGALEEYIVRQNHDKALTFPLKSPCLLGRQDLFLTMKAFGIKEVISLGGGYVELYGTGIRCRYASNPVNINSYPEDIRKYLSSNYKYYKDTRNCKESRC